MEKLAETLLELEIFKRISAKQKLLSFLYISYLWNPVREKIIISDTLNRASKRTTSKRDHRRGGGEDKCKPNEEQGQEEVCIPRLPRMATIYYCCSTATHLIIFVHSILLKVRSVPQDRLADDFITCYMPRLHLHEYLAQSHMIWFNMLFSSLHLFYRGFIQVYGSNVQLDVVTFLLTDKFCSHPPPTLIQSDVISLWYRSDSLLFFRFNLVRQHRVAFRLRPNRTAQARAKLIRLTNLSFILAIICLTTPTIFLIPVGLSELLFNHEPIFEGCHISYFDSVYWFRTLSSLYVCSIMLVETYLEFTFPIGLTSVLVVDLMLYWSHIEMRMWSLRQSLAPPPSWIRADVSLELDHHHEEATDGDMSRDDLSSLPTNSANKNLHTEQEMHEFRALINDFFESLRRTDRFISIVIFFSFFVWLSSNALTTLLGLQLSSSNRDQALLIRGFQLVGIFFISLISYLVLHLKRHTRPAYTTICSLMALDGSRHKKEWIKTVRFYTDKRSHHAFTFLGAGMFNELMFFKFISYTLTLTLLFETMQIHLRVG